MQKNIWDTVRLEIFSFLKFLSPGYREETLFAMTHGH